MSFVELFLVAVGLSMDAFAVSICKGLSAGKASFKQMLIAGAYFGGFQALMPLIGYWLGSSFEYLISSIDHWIVFALLAAIGINMVVEARKDSCSADTSFSAKTMLPLAVATSIDALAVGISLAFLKVEIVPAVSMIGIVTFVLSAVGVKIGSAFGGKYRSAAQITGGIILILIGTKILLEHLGIL